jgi:DNA-binding XRE family transcriptional regulator
MNNAIVDKIKKLRISNGFNHNDMADKLHIIRSAYQR